MKLDVLDLTGKKVGDVELNDSVFACEVNNQAIFDALLRQQSSWRQGTHDTKTRAEVSGGGKKPFRQKGTGRARQGTTRAPQYRHGAVVFGPQPRDWSKKINRKVKLLALRRAIFDKCVENGLTVIEEFDAPEAKTKAVNAVLAKIVPTGKVLLIDDVFAENFAFSLDKPTGAWYNLRVVTRIRVQIQPSKDSRFP